MKLYLIAVALACFIFAAQCTEVFDTVEEEPYDVEDDFVYDDDTVEDVVPSDVDVSDEKTRGASKFALKKIKKFLQHKKQKHHSTSVSFKGLFVKVKCKENTCPKECPGECGSYFGVISCLCKTFINFKNPCTKANIDAGFDLHPFKFDRTKFIHCGPAPGLAYIKNCPHGLVYDEHLCACNYPWKAHH